jgi:archaeal type IV pilus assembly protein PilA
MKNTKAISPIFATLILIAIAVIAGVVVYMFTSGFLAGNTANTNAANEKVTIQAAQATATGITVYAQSTTSTVSITSAIVKDASGNVVDAPVTGLTASVTSDLAPITIAFTNWNTGTNSYTVTLISSQGGSFVSPSFTVTA